MNINRETPFFSVHDLCFSYPDYADEQKECPVLKHLNMTVYQGEFVAVLGHNGSGKSTLAKLLNMILTPKSGSIFVKGREITAPDFTEEDLLELRREVGMVFQNPDNQLVATVVEEDVAFGPENLGIAPQEIERRVTDALQTVHMTEFAHHAPSQLSGGQKQRVAIAGILAMEPECIILDEATAMLDPTGRKDVMQTVRMLHETRGMTVLHITHNMEEAVQADRVLVVHDGEIVMDGTPREVFRQVKRLRMYGLDVPQVTELFFELRERGISLPDDILDEQEGAVALAALLAKAKNPG